MPQCGGIAGTGNVGSALQMNFVLDMGTRWHKYDMQLFFIAYGLLPIFENPLFKLNLFFLFQTCKSSNKYCFHN